MKRFLSIALAVIMIAALAVPITQSQATVSQPEHVCLGQIATSNINANNYSINSRPIYSYLIPTNTGFLRFQAKIVSNGYLVETYNSNLEKQTTKIVPADSSDIFGGFTAYGDYYYVLTGKTNQSESSSATSLVLTKYNKTWTVVSSLKMSNLNTVTPFAGGSARFAWDKSGTYLFIRTSHEMFQSMCNVNHQANMTLSVNVKNMKLVEHQSEISNINEGYVSHSFNQFIAIDEYTDELVALDHGDAMPRGIVLIKYKQYADGNFLMDSGESCTHQVVQTFMSVSKNDNITQSSVGGFAALKNGYLIAHSGHNDSKRDARMTFVSKNNGKVYSKLIEPSLNKALTPQMVKINDTQCVVLWVDGRDVHYTTVTTTATTAQCSTVQIIKDAALSDCQPIYSNGNIIWYINEGSLTKFYSINTSTGNVNTLESDARHQYNANGLAVDADGNECSCKLAIDATAKIQILWGRKPNSVTTTMPIVYVGDELYYQVKTIGTGQGDYRFTIKTTSGINHQLTSASQTGSITIESSNLKIIITDMFGRTTTITPLVAGVLGDVNNDGVVDMSDYILTQLIINKKYTPEDKARHRADFNRDGKLTSEDAKNILNVARTKAPYSKDTIDMLNQLLPHTTKE